MDKTLEATIAALEDRRVAAMVASDAAELDALADDALIYNHSNGLEDTKASYVANVAKGTFNYTKITRDGTRMVQHGDTVFVTGKANIEALLADKVLKVRIMYTVSYVKKPDGWKWVQWQATPLPVG